MIAAVYQERNIRRDGVEVLGYFPVDTAAGPAVNNVLVPSLIGSALFQQERIRKGGNFGVQFRPNDPLDINVTGLYSKFDADNSNANFLAWGQNALGGGGTLTNADDQRRHRGGRHDDVRERRHDRPRGRVRHLLSLRGGGNQFDRRRRDVPAER